jgi:NAD(P) transhydrogenase subunit alpha
MKIAIVKEVELGERRVAMVPAAIARLLQQGGVEVWVESGAGEGTFISDADFEAAGATAIGDPAHLWREADILLKVALPQNHDDRPELDWLQPGSILVGFLDPLGNPDLVRQLADLRVTAFSMELIPRTTRAQSMDALSSQASLAGYKATLLAAAALPCIMPMMTTAAGTIPPAKVLIIGAGVAGLQAIATARRLGAVVEAFDVRPAVKEEVQSLGAKFVDVPLEEDAVAAGGYAKEVSSTSQERIQQVLSDRVQQADIVITTAQVPGKKAPRIVTEAMVNRMKAGSVIVDLAAAQGGNCAFTEAGRTIQHNGITIIGTVNLPASVPVEASRLYANNLLTLMKHLLKDGTLDLNFNDDIIDSACVTHAGEIRNPKIREALLAATL